MNDKSIIRKVDESHLGYRVGESSGSAMNNPNLQLSNGASGDLAVPKNSPLPSKYLKKI